MVRAISKEKKDGGRIIKRRMDEREKEKRKEREERREGGSHRAGSSSQPLVGTNSADTLFSNF